MANRPLTNHVAEIASRKESGPVTRRSFLHTAVTGAALAATFPDFRIQAGTAAPRVHPATPAPAEHEEATISGLSEEMHAGRLSSRAITEYYLGRIDKLDREGPALRSVIELNPDALAIADALDQDRREKGPRGPLHGIPLLIKDNIDTADRMATTAGSLALVGARPPEDAFLVQQLRKAGAVILGKTNLSEWANIRSNHSTSGWSGRGGLTRNPYALDRNTSGSSSGSAVAVTANLCAAAIGTETDGSIVSPSSINGIVGLKPTVGLVSRIGIIPIAHSQDTAGPMTRTVRDAALLLEAITAIDPADKASAARPATATAYSKHLSLESLKGARIGVVRKYFGFLPSVDKLMEHALTLLKTEGAILVDPTDIPSIGKFDETESTVLHYELKTDLNAYLARLGPGAPVHSLKEIIAFNNHHADTEMRYFGQETFLKAEANGPLTNSTYLNALKSNHRLTRTEGIDAAMKKFRLDALVAPTDGPAWVTDLVTGDHFIGGSSSLAAVAGYPSITVPAGFVFGLPVGISFFGQAWSEARLLSLAFAFEQISKLRQPPHYSPTAASM